MGAIVGRSDKLHLEPVGEAAPLPLGGLYLLDRGTHHAAMSVTRVTVGLPLVAQTTFVPYVQGVERMRRLLHLTAALADAVPVHRVAIPATVQAPAVARCLLDHHQAIP
jgi:hypothetical protein